MCWTWCWIPKVEKDERFLERANLGRLHALGAALRDELDLLSFLECLEAASLDLLEVREEVFAATHRRDEAETLGFVEPLYGASYCCSHNYNSLMSFWKTGVRARHLQAIKKGSRD